MRAYHHYVRQRKPIKPIPVKDNSTVKLEDINKAVQDFCFEFSLRWWGPDYIPEQDKLAVEIRAIGQLEKMVSKYARTEGVASPSELWVHGNFLELKDSLTIIFGNYEQYREILKRFYHMKFYDDRFPLAHRNSDGGVLIDFTRASFLTVDFLNKSIDVTSDLFQEIFDFGKPCGGLVGLSATELRKESIPDNLNSQNISLLKSFEGNYILAARNILGYLPKESWSGIIRSVIACSLIDKYFDVFGVYGEEFYGLSIPSNPETCIGNFYWNKWDSEKGFVEIFAPADFIFDGFLFSWKANERLFIMETTKFKSTIEIDGDDRLREELVECKLQEPNLLGFVLENDRKTFLIDFFKFRDQAENDLTFKISHFDKDVESTIPEKENVLDILEMFNDKSSEFVRDTADLFNSKSLNLGERGFATFAYTSEHSLRQSKLIGLVHMTRFIY